MYVFYGSMTGTKQDTALTVTFQTVSTCIACATAQVGIALAPLSIAKIKPL